MSKTSNGHCKLNYLATSLVRIHFFLGCKNAEIFVMISQVVSDSAKISVSVPSSPWTAVHWETDLIIAGCR